MFVITKHFAVFVFPATKYGVWCDAGHRYAPRFGETILCADRADSSE